MARIYRHRVTFTGGPGGDGVATFYSLDPAGMELPLKDFWMLALKDLVPSTITITIPASGEQIEATDGSLVGAWASGSVLALPGGSGGPFASPVGALVNWITPTFTDGSHIRGKTFLVPLAASVFDLTGNIAAGTLTVLQGLADVFVTSTANNFVIWHRPIMAPGNPIPTRNGSFAFVTSAVVPDKAVVLRSRRD